MTLSPASPLPRYACAVAAVLLAVLARLQIDPLIGGERYPYAFQYIALAFVAWYGGFGPALLAIIIGSLATRFFVLAPRNDWAIADSGELWGMLRYYLDGFAIALLGAAVNVVRGRSSALRASEARYRQLVELSLDAIWIHTDGRIVYANAEAARILGAADPQALIGRSAMEIVHPDDRDRARQRTATMAGTGARAPLTVMKFCGLGDTAVQLEVRATPLEYEGRQSIVAVGRDVTERSRLEEQLHQAQKLEAVGQLTGGIAHDFNNLLTVIVCNLDILREQPGISPGAVQSVDLALNAALRGSDLTRQLIAFARRQALVPQAFSLNDRVSATVGLLHRTLGEHVEIKLILEPDLWPAIADPSQLESALVNLAINARDAMARSGRLTIETSNAHLDADYTGANVDVAIGDYVVLSVSDTGGGMAPDVLARAFEPFFTTKQNHGSGLGLSMVYGFARQSRGHVKIYSEPGHGTTVRLYLPRAAEQVPKAPAAKPERVPAARASERILVVEDNPDVRKTVIRQLTELGYDTIEASGGKEAMAILSNGEKVDLLFSDVVMPGGMDGVELAEAASTARPDLKILLTSGFARASIQSERASHHLKTLLSKPYRKAELAARLRAMLDTPK